MAGWTRAWVRRGLQAAGFAALVLIFTVIPAHAAGSAASPLPEQPEAISSLQDQCLARAGRADNPDRMTAICVGWAILALDRSPVRAAKAEALRDACIREIWYGADKRIRESARMGEELCRDLYATVAD